MSIRLKLLSAALIAFVAYLLVMFLLWMPWELKHAREDFVDHQTMILAAMDSDTIRHLLARDYAALYSSLDEQMLQQEQRWLELKLQLANGRRIYPLFPEQREQPSPSSTVLTIDHSVILGDREMARILLRADWKLVRQNTFEAIYLLVAFLATALVIVMIVALALAERFVRQPLNRLTEGAHQIAEGNYDVDLPVPGKDEIGDLATSFQLMRDRLLQSHQALVETARKAEQAEHYQRSLLENIGEGLISVGEDGRVLNANPAAAGIFGYRQDSMSGLPATDLIPGKLSEPTAIPVKLQGVRSDGSVFPLEIVLSRMTVDGRRICNLILRDITLRDQAESALHAAKEAAESTARAKSEFLANMSHEIRTPLNAILGLARIGLRESLAAEQQKNFDHILNSGKHLLGVVNDILDFSKMEAGKFTIDSHPFPLADSIEEVADALADRAGDKGLTLQLQIDNSLPEWLEGDPLRLQQILLNLLSNAIKFTEHGGVSLHVQREGDDVHFIVQDSGIGMNEAQIARLFNPFEQADSSTTRRFGGTGLGLAISKNLAKLMHGRISVNSQVGVGSRFTLILPLRATEPPASSEQMALATDEHMQLSGIRILAAEDLEINRIILEDLLEHEGAHVVFAEGGQQALNRLEEHGPSGFDLVLMDVQMPVMDGHEATRRIRKMAPALPVIGLTAHALQEERDRCLASGMVDHVTKPIDPDVLTAAILAHVASTPSLPNSAPEVR
ncbi:MAG: response regulator [Chromatiaceae bacterium]|nr:response regulator [Chromatiaceae bacterium]MCP5315939.1 response regulator [Chromatiaceae bacterium]